LPYLLVPHSLLRPGQAVVWVGVVKESGNLPNLTLQSNAGMHPLGPWKTLIGQSNGFRLDYQRVTIDTLQAGAPYRFLLMAHGQVLADCQLRTLPAQLPTLGEPEFIVLLASCFCSARDEGGTLGQTFTQLPGAERPNIKILSGDQVYLDDPATHFLWHTHTRAELEEEHFANYLRTWTQTGLAGGFQQVLKDGANYFSSDDHEFWNNAPSWASFVRDSWSAQGRANWMAAARSLYNAFQTEEAVTQFNVGTLSFFIADTRINRDEQRQQFMTSNDLAALKRWISNLQGLGVLVIGQPVLSDRAGWSGKLTDWNLPDYQQYQELVQALTQATRSIIILTGDVHYGRVASCQLRPDVELIEIISSPTALVNKLVGGKWNAAPKRFPAFDVPGAVQTGVRTDLNFTLTDNHFLTLGFSSVGTRTRVVVKAWPIARNGKSVNSIFVMERIL